mmetsp:Transcript_21486/g.34116  ORF Transcript_21486/g.34116 Transcript_21486/m.34116 type:complete len:241 (-) Transcript_21486:321-1043(-)
MDFLVLGLVRSSRFDEVITLFVCLRGKRICFRIRVVLVGGNLTPVVRLCKVPLCVIQLPCHISDLGLPCHTLHLLLLQPFPHLRAIFVSLAYSSLPLNVQHFTVVLTVGAHKIFAPVLDHFARGLGHWILRFGLSSGHLLFKFFNALYLGHLLLLSRNPCAVQLLKNGLRFARDLAHCGNSAGITVNRGGHCAVRGSSYGGRPSRGVEFGCGQSARSDKPWLQLARTHLPFPRSSRGTFG